MRREENKDDLLMIDSGCDIPFELFEKGKIGVLPLLLKTEESPILDTRDVSVLMDRYNSDFFEIDKIMRTKSADENILKACILKFLRDQVEKGKTPKRLHIQHADSRRSKEFKETLVNIQKEFFDIRSRFHKEVVGVVSNSSFSIKLYDTKQVFSGQAILALETLNMIENHRTFDAIRTSINCIIPNTETYIIPNDISYLSKRARDKGDNSINKIQEIMLKMTGILPVIMMKNSKTKICSKERYQSNGFKFVINELKDKFNKNKNSISKELCISYAGNIDSFKEEFKSELAELDRLAMQYKLNINFSIASSSAGINVGPKSIFISCSF